MFPMSLWYVDFKDKNYQYNAGYSGAGIARSPIQIAILLQDMARICWNHLFSLLPEDCAQIVFHYSGLKPLSSPKSDPKIFFDNFLSSQLFYYPSISQRELAMSWLGTYAIFHRSFILLQSLWAYGFKNRFCHIDRLNNYLDPTNVDCFSFQWFIQNFEWRNYLDFFVEHYEEIKKHKLFDNISSEFSFALFCSLRRKNKHLAIS